MAIASSTEQEEGSNQVILAVVRNMGNEQMDLEKKIRRGGFAILQQRNLELDEESVNSWFPPTDETAKEPEEYIGYVLQRRNAVASWNEFAEDVGRDVCGVSDESEAMLQAYFPSVVTEDYLLNPQETADYLNQIKPTLMAGLQQICADNPEDPVQHLADWLENTDHNITTTDNE